MTTQLKTGFKILILQHCLFTGIFFPNPALEHFYIEQNDKFNFISNVKRKARKRFKICHKIFKGVENCNKCVYLLIT
jgi:hypothetical protein